MLGQNNIADFTGVNKFINELEMFQQGTLNEGEFTALRLANGIYGQRQDDAYMVRIKIPGGILNLDQLNCINDIADQYSDVDFSNITTRQDIQLHFVPLKNLPTALLKLAEVGLTTREACGNTVRNVTACQLAGVCDKEHVDIRPILDDTVSHFLRHTLTQYMPRKIKMSFSGCEQDCAMGVIHDVGVVAVKKDGVVGFKVLVGGGLGHKPRRAITLENFVPQEKIRTVIESVIAMHNRYSNRKMRAKSRLKFLVDKFGEQGFRDRYEEILNDVTNKIENTTQDESKVIQFYNKDSNGKVARFDKDKHQVEIAVQLGDIKNAQVVKLTHIMEKHQLTKLRVTQTQNLVLHDIPSNILEALNEDLSSTGFKNDAFKLFDTKDAVACPGNWTCRLGITNSRQLAKNLDDDDIDMKVHVSGCHNGCAQPQLAEIGLHGEARRMFGKLIPYYQMYFGGNGTQGGEFGMKGPEIPASRAEHAVKLVKRTFEADHAETEKFEAWSKRKGLNFFSELLEDITTVTADELPFLLKDVGSENEFKVLQLGGGECAGIAEETVASQLAEAKYEKQYRDIFTRQADITSAVDCAENMLRLVGKSILFTQGLIVGKEMAEISDKMTSTLTDYPSVIASFKQLASETTELRNSADAPKFILFSEKLDKWISSLVKENSIVLVKEKLEVVTAPEESISIVDLSKEVCPMHYIKARQALRSVKNGDTLKLIVTSGGDEKLVTDSLTSTGFEVSVSGKTNTENQIILSVKKPLQWNDKGNKKIAGAEVA